MTRNSATWGNIKSKPLDKAARGPHGMDSGGPIGPTGHLKASLNEPIQQQMHQNIECHIIGENLPARRVSKPSIFLTSHLLNFSISFFFPWTVKHVKHPQKLFIKKTIDIKKFLVYILAPFLIERNDTEVTIKWT